MLRTEMARDINFRERFYREAQNSGKLNHPNIVAVYDTGETEMDGMTIPYIVMERVNGRTLRDIIREDGALSAQEAADILKPVADALQASHEAGIIHRDIKPANIMLTNTGQVKVMDFGIARALDDSTSAMTQTSAVIGTAQYLSPQQARGKNADARSDVGHRLVGRQVELLHHLLADRALDDAAGDVLPREPGADDERGDGEEGDEPGPASTPGRGAGRGCRGPGIRRQHPLRPGFGQRLGRVLVAHVDHMRSGALTPRRVRPLRST